ncbi:hypothetical protein PN466_22155 [Roseofilum reptotaenium CS-1145]|nr:hypothetical protein [Roseofilum reptotaenium]MDB9519652.1 hypothetical protein [Roseofilum reptotaenium CS-1145]
MIPKWRSPFLSCVFARIVYPKLILENSSVTEEKYRHAIAQH